MFGEVKTGFRMTGYKHILSISLLGLWAFAQNVGIGTSTPTAKLHVFNPAGTSASLMGYFQNLNNAAGNNGVLIDIARNQADAYGLHVQSGGSSRLYVRGDGRVGVGTTSPQGTLHIVQERPGTDNPRGIVVEHYSNDPWAGQVNQQKARGTRSAPLPVLGEDVLAGWHGMGYDGQQFHYGGSIQMVAAENWASNAHGTYIRFRTIPVGSTALSEQVRITDNGFVGIGTPTPSQRLDVVGGIAWGVFNKPYPTTPSGQGIVGRGVTSNYRIALQDGSGRVSHYWNSYYDGTAHRYVVANEHASRMIMGWGWAGEAFRFQIAPQGANAGDPITWTDALMINYSGNVGIGTINPTERLEVNGNVRADAFIANKYPRVVAAIDVGGSVTIDNAPTGWIPVPATSTATNMEASITVDGPNDLYLVTYTYRVQAVNGVHKWSGIRILQGATMVKFIHADGGGPSLSRPDYGASGAVFVTGLAAGTYTIQLMDHSGGAENRTFTSERQLLIYRMR